MCFDHHHHHFIENRKVLLALFVESTVLKKATTMLKIGSHSGALANTIMTVLRGCHHDLLWFCNNAFKGCWTKHDADTMWCGWNLRSCLGQQWYSASALLVHTWIVASEGIDHQRQRFWGHCFVTITRNCRGSMTVLSNTVCPTKVYSLKSPLHSNITGTQEQTCWMKIQFSFIIDYAVTEQPQLRCNSVSRPLHNNYHPSALNLLQLVQVTVWWKQCLCWLVI